MCVLDLTNDYGLVPDDWFFSKTCSDPKIDFSSFVSSPNIEDRTKRLEANFDNDWIWENTSDFRKKNIARKVGLFAYKALPIA